MSNVDWARVILAGLVAGVIINLFEFVLNVIVAKDMEMAIRAFGRQMGGVQLAMFSMWAFLVGIFAVWLYAGIPHRFHLDIPQTRP